MCPTVQLRSSMPASIRFRSLDRPMRTSLRYSDIRVIYANGSTVVKSYLYLLRIQKVIF
jgi:hypothetical protein